MAVADEKLERFERAIFTEVEAQSAEILGEVDAYKAQQIEAATDEELEKSYTLIQHKMDEFRSEFSRKITREKLNVRQRVLSHRLALIESLFEEAGQKLQAFTATEDYAGWLTARLEESRAELSGSTLLVRAEDMDLMKRLAPGVPLTEDPQNKLGGFAILNEEAGRFLDETFAARLETEKERFYQNDSLGLEIDGPEETA